MKLVCRRVALAETRTAVVREISGAASIQGAIAALDTDWPFPMWAKAVLHSCPAHGGWTLDPRFIDDLARKLSAAVPPSVIALRRDLEDNFKAVLQAGLNRLDLVSRQEFDVQAAVLRRTREKLEALEARLATLEGNKTNSDGVTK